MPRFSRQRISPSRSTGASRTSTCPISSGPSSLLERLLDVAETRRPSAHLAFGALAAASVATKDQAYATYLFVLPIYLYVSLRGSDAGERRQTLKTIAKAFLVALAVYGFASGALLNPTGFVKRLAELGGPASQDWRLYSRDATGLLANVRAIVARQPADFWPLPMLALAYGGLLVAVLRRAGGDKPTCPRRSTVRRWVR